VLQRQTSKHHGVLAIHSCENNLPYEWQLIWANIQAFILRASELSWGLDHWSLELGHWSFDLLAFPILPRITRIAADSWKSLRSQIAAPAHCTSLPSG